MRLLRDRAADLRLALMLLTRVPMGTAPLRPGATLARAVWAYPLAGALVGGLAGGVFALAMAAGLSAPVAAILGLAASVLLTGALHEDGLADFCDGLGGGGDVARKLEIMRDSRIGTYGSAALIVSFLLRWSALASLGLSAKVVPVWIAAGALSRAAIALPLWLLPPARRDGLGAQAAAPPGWSALLAVAIAAVIAWAAVRERLLALAAIIPAAAIVVTWVARRHLRGHTGDVLGATALVAECAGLTIASAGWF